MHDIFNWITLGQRIFFYAHVSSSNLKMKNKINIARQMLDILLTSLCLYHKSNSHFVSFFLYCFHSGKVMGKIQTKLPELPKYQSYFSLIQFR